MNLNEKQQFLAHWSGVRRRGIVWYVLAVAASWGTVFAVFFQFIFVLLEHDLHLETLQTAYGSRDFLKFWGWCLFTGLIVGLLLWFFYQMQFKRAIRSEQ